ncbi:ribonuclease P protein component [Candidatus Parcubacteria bacterium]|nr:ribonuclease P protein component [Candidatus Parcubacteria bacterium]
MARRTTQRRGFFIEARSGEPDGQWLRIVVPKSVHKRAVRRNMLRRQVREWVRRRLGPGGAPARLTIRISKEALSLSRQSRYDLLAEQFAKIGF